MSRTPRKQLDNPIGEALRQVRATFLSVGFFSFFINLLVLTGPLYMLQVYDRVLTSGSRHTLIMLTVVAVGMILTGALLELVRSRVLVRIGSRLDNALSERLFAGLLRQRLRQNDDAGSQPLRDLESLRGFLTGSGLISFFDAPWTPLFLVIVFLLHPLLGLVALSGAVILFVLALISEFATRTPLREASRDSAAAHGFAEATLRNAEVIEAMGMLPALQQRWQQRHHAALSAQATASDRGGLLTAGAKFVRPVLQVAILGTGAYLALQQIITPGVMIAASIIMGRALAPVEGAIGQWRGFILARAAHTRLKNFTAKDPSPESALPLPRPKGAVSIERLVAAAPGLDKPVLKGISFALEAGDSLGIIGPSAAGKSTLARLLIGVWHPSAGHVRLDGADIGDWDHVQLGPALGYLPQDVELFDGTIADNIARFGSRDPAKIVRAAERANVHEMILRLPQGYDTVIGQGGAALSGGQRQRVGLARALYDDPAFVVLDEPNANLDGDGEEALRRAVAELKNGGTTLVVIAHRPSILANMDKLLVLRDGLIEQFGPRADVMPKVTKAVPQQRHRRDRITAGKKELQA
ncbi:type I secretion system permease/ATPase [Pelagibius litoralis]|uniref:Type I secretion system permease/ATPase n=1 Tax=Pelagibius litoralis TaxID=374515 RepID=A0A967C3B9_9PROT|nr:type I secretion system permease/ATPase [Pelagibius litoralis]NIA67455.1 type I secretion system permease/ATPase [Pelagibius litoralis]